MENVEINIPPIIYKYINLKNGLKILIDKTIKLSCPDTFNDPFDFSNDLLKFKVSKEYAADLVNRNFQNDPRAERRIKIRKLLTDPNIDNITDNSKTKQKSNYRVSCFSGIKDEILMWSHYADKHTGICIGISMSPNTPDYFVLPVNYTIDFNPPDFLTETEKSLRYWMTTKYQKWDYEEEYRMINILGFELATIKQNSIQEIIFGCKVDEKVITETTKLLTKNGYDLNIISKMKKSNSRFELKQVKI